MTYIVIEEHEYSEDTFFTVFKTFNEAKKYVMTINPEEDPSLIEVHIAELKTGIRIHDQDGSIYDLIDKLEPHTIFDKEEAERMAKAMTEWEKKNIEKEQGLRD